MSETTVLIAARNASATIGRAIQSVVLQGRHPIVLVDDFSTDDTTAIAKEVGGSLLTIVHPPRHGPLGLTRQIGLNAVTTKYTMLLDADDELLPGRIKRMGKALKKTGYEVFTDALFLHDGKTGAMIRELPIPTFITKTPVPVRLFERNYLPGIGQIGFHTDLALQVGYDLTLHGPEDLDIAVRMMLAGGRFHFEHTPGYRMYAYKGSVSRHLDRQREMYRRCLAKFTYDTIRSLYLEQGQDERTTLWALVSVATYRKEYNSALEFLDLIQEIPLSNAFTIAEPDGPFPFPERWRLLFQRGTLLLLLNKNRDAIKYLLDAYSIYATPETANNLAVTHFRFGNKNEGIRMLECAILTRPDYYDAIMNLKKPSADRITTHSLRNNPTRKEYI
ncbi:glycosyltransferase [Thiocystis violacea]|uniref:glycosyltransferase n=1 Tax=Thiocystis violacea TaxID=13725 RepID=UPI0019062B17